MGVEILGGRACLVERHPCGQDAGPPVVLVNGCGMPRSFWQPVVSPLAREAICFDRPGMGTPWPGHLPTLAEEVASLADLVPAGATVVAHSMAAFHVEGLVLSRPGLVGAVVLVDPSIEWEPRRSWPGAGRWAALAGRAASVGPVGRLMGEVGVVTARAQTVSRLPEHLRAAIREGYAGPDGMAAAVAEFMAYEAQAGDLLDWRREGAWEPPPTTVLTAIPRHPTPAQRRFAEHWRAHHVLVSHARHLVMLDAPEAVLAAIAAPGGGAA